MGGDFFREIPVQAEAYLMRWIIHDWADDKAIAILKNVRRAAPPGARLALVEWVLSETADLDAGKWMDINMLVNQGGRERTRDSWDFRDGNRHQAAVQSNVWMTAHPDRTWL